MQDRVTAQVQELLLNRIADLRGGRVDDLAPGLRADADEVIRPMSHEMVAPPAPAPRAVADADVGRVRWSDIWSTASLGQPFRPIWSALLITVSSLALLTSNNSSLSRGLTYAVIGGLLIAGVLALLRRLVAPRLRTMDARRRTALLIASVVVGLEGAAVVWALIMDAAGSEHGWLAPIGIGIAGPTVVLALAVQQGFRQQSESADAELMAAGARLQYAAALAGTATWHEERRLSRALHGPVQTAVRAAAMRIEQGDLASAERMLVEALGHLDTDQRQTSVRTALADIARAWDGLCAVDLDLPDDLAARIDQDPPLASAIVDICTDACSNAVRHGGATSVAMRALPVGDTLDLVVSDDGAPDSGAGLPGLGSAMLDDVSLTWLRRREDGRTVLRATLPLGGARTPAARHGVVDTVAL
jgi:signal transduction histidine kinase